MKRHLHLQRDFSGAGEAGVDGRLQSHPECGGGRPGKQKQDRCESLFTYFVVYFAIDNCNLVLCKPSQLLNNMAHSRIEQHSFARRFLCYLNSLPTYPR